MALQALELAPFAVFGVVGAWLLVTGRKLFFELPDGLRRGWQLRLGGLVYCVAAAFFAYQVIRGSFFLDALVPTYAALAIGIWVALSRRRKLRNPQAADSRR
jgi:hypothetical protein